MGTSVEPEPGAAIAPEPAARAEPALRDDAYSVGRWVLLGASAGGLAGFLIGGVGGRLAMFILRLTSPDSVIGAESDDGFTIGEFTTDTIFLLLLTTGFAVVIGMLYVAARWFLPPNRRVAAWTAMGGLIGGAALVHADGVDFNILEPQWLAIAMFVAIPTAAAFVMATWVERWSRTWWWHDRRRTIVALIPAFPLLVPIILFIALAGAGAVVTMGRIPLFRDLPSRPSVRLAGSVVVVVVIVLGALALTNDIREIL